MSTVHKEDVFRRPGDVVDQESKQSFGIFE